MMNFADTQKAVRTLICTWLVLSEIFVAAQTNPTYNVKSPTILAFFTPVSHAEPKEAGADEALADFQVYGQRALKSLARMGVDYKEVYASGFIVKVGEFTTTFRPTEGVGYYFVAPGKKPRIEYGVMTDIDLSQAAHNYFGVNENQQQPR